MVAPEDGTMVADPQQNTPRSLQPIYTTGVANAPIELWEGELDVGIGDQRASGNGRIRFLWQPAPHIGFEMLADNAFWLYGADEVSLRLTERGIDAKGHVTRSSIGERTEISGRLAEPRAIGVGTNLSYAMFHVVNFQSVRGNLITDGTRTWGGESRCRRKLGT